LAGPARIPQAILLVALIVTAVGVILEFANLGNSWLFFEDVQLVVAPAGGALALAILAFRGEPARRAFRLVFAVALGFTAFGQLVADLPDAFPALAIPGLRIVSELCNVVGAVAGIAILWRTVYRQLEEDARRQVLLDGLIIMVASVTFIMTNWLTQTALPGANVSALFAAPTPSLLVPLVSALFLSTAAAAGVGALALRVEPARRGVWAVIAGIALIDLAWNGWFSRILSGAPDSLEPMDVMFPIGALLTAYGGMTWTLKPGGGPRYERLAKAISEWLPIAAILGCVFIDVMPRQRPTLVDPIAIGTCFVMLLAVVRQRSLQGRAEDVSERLSMEIKDRAATTVSLALLEGATTIEEAAQRICAEALRIDGIDTVEVFAFSPAGVVPLANSGPQTRPVTLNELLPPSNAGELREHADFGLWVESWAGRTPRDDFERAIIASGLRAEALAPLVWNDKPIGLLSMGAMAPDHARRLSDRLATLTEFSVISAAVLGPMLCEAWRKERLQNEVEAIISSGAFVPVFQPVVDLKTGRSVGYEALTRFADGTRPDLAFLAADKVGMMVKLETATLREQIKQARSLPKDTWLSLNISPALAMALTPLLDVLSDADRPVVLEITEHAEIEDYPRLMAALDSVREVARLAVDDAGAGYAGLRHILELQPHFVKLDISLVRNVDSDPARQAMVIGMAHFAASVGCDLIAEGIETANELTTLKVLGVAFGQGFLLGRPSAVEATAIASTVAPAAVAASPRRSRGASVDAADVAKKGRLPRAARPRRQRSVTKARS
jgi:EAL domain-containing protein (putative c-di-GMP-specific phosphodiesterase class I)